MDRAMAITKDEHKQSRYIYLACFVSLCWLTFLVSSIRPGVFFSLDGGVKLMIVKQLNQGHGFKYIDLPQPQWVHDIWNEGYFPFRPPFAYASPKGYLFSFPPAFSIISSFFYLKFGYAGLYVIPMLSTILLWVFMILLLNRIGVDAYKIAAAVFILVFCSPLSIYAATFWEHSLAVLLLFTGTAFIVKPVSGSPAAFLSGLLCGLAAWLRPEALVMLILYGLALVILYAKQKQPAYLVFIGGMALSVVGFLLFNQVEYGSPFGVHGYQVLNEGGFGDKIKKALNILISINEQSIRHFPFILLLIPVIYRLIKDKNALDLRSVLLLCIIIGFCMLTPFILPNDGQRQFGPRYFLPIIPIVIVALALVERQWKLIENRKLPVWLTAIVLLIAGYSFYRDAYKGGMKILPWENNGRIKPALDFVKQNGNVIVVGAGTTAMEMADVFNEKYFFQIDDDASLDKLLLLLKRQGIHEFVYIYDVNDPRGLPLPLQSAGVHLRKKGDFTLAKCYID